MSKIQLKNTKEILFKGTKVKSATEMIDELDSLERKKVSLNKLAGIFQFNLYCKIEIEAMIKTYGYRVDAKMSKKLDFYTIIEEEKRAKTLSAANVNSVIAMGDSFILNSQLQEFEMKMLNDTLAANYNDKFSIDKKLLKRFILDNLYDEESFYEVTFNLVERVRIAFIYVYKSRVARSRLM